MRKFIVNVCSSICAVFALASCNANKNTPAYILCGDSHKYWAYTSGVPGDSSWMAPSHYYFNIDGTFLKRSRLWLKTEEFQMYEPHWKVYDKDKILIAGYEYRILKMTKNIILLYNKYNGGYVDTLKYVEDKDMPKSSLRTDARNGIISIQYSED